MAGIGSAGGEAAGDLHHAKLIKRSTSPEERRAAFDTVRGYMEELIAEKEANPPDDLLGRQIVKLREDGTYRRASLAATGACPARHASSR